VHDTHWLTPEIFATGVGLSYVTPGPVVILATYVGERVAGVPGAVAATIAVFTVPVALAGAAARAALHLQRHRWFRSFGSYAAAAAIGLLGVTLFDLARPLGEHHPIVLLGAVLVIGAERAGAPPIALIVTAAVIGAVGTSVARL